MTIIEKLQLCVTCAVLIALVCVGFAMTELHGGFQVTFGKEDPRLVMMAQQMNGRMK